jgi:hypothetical protein
MTRCCKTCIHLDVPPDAKGRRVVRSREAYACRWPAPPVMPLPDSITGAFAFRARMNFNQRSYMEGGEGTACPTWEPLETETQRSE